jgi:hypothetical protein
VSLRIAPAQGAQWGQTSRLREEYTKALGSNAAIRWRPASALQPGSAFRCRKRELWSQLSVPVKGAGASRSYDGLVSSR